MRAGKAPTTQAGAFVHEEMDKIRRGEHGARSPEQAIAIGISKARRAGIDLPPPPKGQSKKGTRESAAYAYSVGSAQTQRQTPASRRLGCVPDSQARTAKIRFRKKLFPVTPDAQPRAAPLPSAPLRHARTKGASGRSDAARKGSRTRTRRRS